MTEKPEPRRLADPLPRKRILVVGHSAYRAGAEMSLLHILRWLTANYPADFSLLLKAGGDLQTAYTSVLPTDVFAPPRGRAAAWLPGLARLLRRIRHPAPDYLNRIDLLYCNTVVSLDLLPELPLRSSCPVICHVHELDMSIRRYSSLERFKRAQARIDAYIAVSGAVANNLIANHQVPPERIHQIYEAIPLPDTMLQSQWRAETRERLSIPADAFIVGGCGTMDWRKAPDLFLVIAQRIVRGAPTRPIHFLWVGGRTSGWDFEVLRHDIAKMGLQNVVHFVGPQPEPLKYFSAFDAFLLTSREDPFPLVCLEAAALALPIICFANSGGMPEFVETDAGFVVPYLDIDQAADSLAFLARSEEVRSALGRRAAEKVKGYDIEVVGQQIAAVLATHLRASPRS